MDIAGLLADHRFVARFWSKVAEPNENGCRLWTAGRGGSKRVRPRAHVPARFTDDGKVGHTYAYRLAWELTNRTEIPAGMTIDHLCYEPLCCEPDHLEVVSMAENRERALDHYRRHVRRTPRPYVNRKGETKWRARYRDYSSGRVMERSKTFSTRAEAEHFLLTCLTAS